MLTDSFRNVLNVEIYALIGFIIFFTFFIFVSVQAFRMKKDEESKLSNMPLEDSFENGNGQSAPGSSNIK